MRKPARSPFSKRCPPIWMSRGKQSPPMPCTASGKPAARGFSAKETDRSQTVEKNAGCLRKATDGAYPGALENEVHALAFGCGFFGR